MTDFHRRDLIGCGAATILGLAGSAAHAASLAKIDEVDREKWLSGLWDDSAKATDQKGVRGALNLFRFKDEIYATTKPIGWDAKGTGSSYKALTVPTYFVTDLASVPSIFWSILPRDGKYIFPAIVHDYLYWMQDRSREEADDIFRLGMTEFGVDTIKLNAIYWAVRAAGWAAWDANAELKKQGQRRIIAQLPGDPLMTWETWQKRPYIYDLSDHRGSRPV